MYHYLIRHELGGAQIMWPNLIVIFRLKPQNQILNILTICESKSLDITNFIFSNH